MVKKMEIHVISFVLVAFLPSVMLTTSKEKSVCGDVMTAVDNCLVWFHFPECYVTMCTVFGELRCLNETLVLSEQEVQEFVKETCMSYNQERGCKLIQNSTTLLLTVNECESVCKMFST